MGGGPVAPTVPRGSSGGNDGGQDTGKRILYMAEFYGTLLTELLLGLDQEMPGFPEAQLPNHPAVPTYTHPGNGGVSGICLALFVPPIDSEIQPYRMTPTAAAEELARGREAQKQLRLRTLRRIAIMESELAYHVQRLEKDRQMDRLIERNNQLELENLRLRTAALAQQSSVSPLTPGVIRNSFKNWPRHSPATYYSNSPGI